MFKNESPSYRENIMWNVALDKISFMPLQSSDQLSGVITTEWFQTQDDLNNRIKLVIYVAFLFSMPWLFYQAWMFISPGLYKNEKRFTAPLMLSTIILFFTGVSFAFF